MATKINNIEHIWATLKNKLPSYAVISKIDKSYNAFDVTIPKSRVTSWPKGIKNVDLNFTFSWTGGLIAFLEQANIEDDSITTIEDATSFITKYIDMNESFNINESIIIDVEDNDELKGFDKLITFENCGLNRNQIESKLKKSGKKFFLEVYPSNEAGLYVSKKDENFFKGYLETICESLKESGSTVALGLIQHIDKDFVTTLSDDGLRNAINQIKTDLEIVSNSPDENVKVYHRSAQDKYEILTSEFRKRGLPLDEGFTFALSSHAIAHQDICDCILKQEKRINYKDMLECIWTIYNEMQNYKSYSELENSNK